MLHGVRLPVAVLSEYEEFISLRELIYGRTFGEIPKVNKEPASSVLARIRLYYIKKVDYLKLVPFPKS